MGTGARHSVSVAAVVTDDEGRVLVTQRQDNGRWEPPGGVLELDESIEDGLRREVLEETGYDIEPIALTGVYKNMSRHIVALVFRARLAGGAARSSTETASIEWWLPGAIRQRMEEAYAVRVADALAATSHAAIRIHDGHNILHATQP